MFEAESVFAAPQAALVAEDEQAKYQRLVEQGREAAALEVEGKHANVAWVQALKDTYPDVPRTLPTGGRTTRKYTNPKVYEAIMEARQCDKQGAYSFLGVYRNEKVYEVKTASNLVGYTRRLAIRRAAVELATKYRLGADPRECMEALAKFIEESRNGKA